MPSRRTVLATLLAGVAGTAGCGPGPGEPSNTGGVGPGAPTTATGPTPGEVEATRRALDARASTVPDSVVSWGIEPGTGLVVVHLTGERTPAVDRFLAGLDPRTYRVIPTAERPRPLPGTGPPTAGPGP